MATAVNRYPLLQQTFLILFLRRSDVYAGRVWEPVVFHLGSSYNLVPRPAVLLVDERQIQVMERRESYDDLLARIKDGEV